MKRINFKNIVGERYGKLVVVSICEEKSTKGKCVIWNCVCDCGKIKQISGRELRAGDAVSCGCGRKIEMEIGARYGNLVVISCSGKNKHGSYMWLCQCDCGNQKEVKGDNLRKGITKSCGCSTAKLNRLRFCKEPGVAAFNGLYGLYKRQSKNRNIPFILDKNEFSIITKGNCYYCGCEPFQEYKNKNNNGGYIYNGIDRIDSQKGYQIGNVVPCCGQCNFAKREMSIAEFANWITKVCNNFIIK